MVVASTHSDWKRLFTQSDKMFISGSPVVWRKYPAPSSWRVLFSHAACLQSSGWAQTAFPGTCLRWQMRTEHLIPADRHRSPGATILLIICDPAFAGGTFRVFPLLLAAKALALIRGRDARQAGTRSEDWAESVRQAAGWRVKASEWVLKKSSTSFHVSPVNLNPSSSLCGRFSFNAGSD